MRRRSGCAASVLEESAHLVGDGFRHVGARDKKLGFDFGTEETVAVFSEAAAVTARTTRPP